MKPEAQRIAIAQACGWKKVRINDRGEQVWEAPPSGGRFPDYLNDLNAMNEAEEHIPTHKIGEYMQELGFLINGSRIPPILWGSLYHYAHATAAQRAEALLKTIGKWVDV